MVVREFPERPNLEYLKNQARGLLREAAEPEARARLAAAGVRHAPPRLADALHAIAREYGFPGWPALKVAVAVRTGEPAEALAAAVRGGDVAQVREVLRRHPGLRERLNEPLPGDAFGTTALLVAAGRGDRAVAEVLLDAGADPNARSVWWAGSFGVLDVAPLEMAAWLLERGVGMDLHAACRLGDAARVRTMLAEDPGRVHARGADGQLPLHFAATTEIAEALLGAGAAIDARDVDHESTAAQYMAAAEPRRHEVARFLIEQGATADLLMAAALGDEVLVERILDDDPEAIRITVSERNFPRSDPRSGGSIYYFGFGWTQTAHTLAHRFGHAEVYELLMRRSPNWLRLVYAAEVGDEAMFRRVLAGHPGLFGKLSAAAARRLLGVAVRNNTEAIAMLLAAGWPATAAMETGPTALHFAAFQGNPAMVRLLLQHGAAVNVVEQEHGGTPLSWALYGSEHPWPRSTGEYGAAVEALLEAGGEMPPVAKPPEATDEVLEVLAAWARRKGGGTAVV